MSLTFNFDGKVVLITGSSSGIGAATAIQFAKAGANVVVTGRNAKNVSSVAIQCNEVSPKKLKALEVVADVTKQEDAKRLVDTTIKTFGKLDILVNNAGAAIMVNVTDPTFYEKYEQTLDTNLNSVVYLTHLSVEHLEKTKGNIINISSIVGIRSVSDYTFNTKQFIFNSHHRERALSRTVWPKRHSICSADVWPQSWDQREYASMLSSN